ncbi:MAG: ParA family protein, partial [Alphaproteobacteria bacterium]|nr:ParA family protein [Alphaproteobacteria bacterium]
IFGLKLPSEIYAQHMFSTKIVEGGLVLPKIHLIVKNRITQYMGPASGYAAVLASIDDDLRSVVRSHPQYFTFGDVDDGIVEVRDFQSTGVVAFARGAPFFAMSPGKLTVGDKRIAIDRAQRDERAKEMKIMASML